MINPHRGDVEVVIDGEPRVARLTLGAIAVLETRLEAGSLQALAKRFEGGQMSMQDVLEILSVALDMPVAELEKVDIEGGAAGAAHSAALLLARYRAMSLEELLPDIVFPLEENARAIAEEIRQINQDMHREMFGKKSAVWDALNFSEAADAFVALVGNIVAGVRESIEETITAQAGSERTETDIVEAVERTVSDYQERAIPHKLDMLATHFNGKLSELEQQREGYRYYIWRSQGDDKVRDSHADNDGSVFAWDEAPATGHPGHGQNCRCWAEPYSPPFVALPDGVYDPPLEDVYPEAVLIPAVRLEGIAAQGLRAVRAAVLRVFRNPVTVRPRGVPKDWIKRPSRNKEGYRYGRPGREAYDEVRVQRGQPKSEYPNSQKPYVRWKKDGRWLDKDGNPVAKKDPKGHIPLEEFEFKKDLFK